MILVDTSVWVDHVRYGDERLSALLLSDQVLMHPFVLVEIALGSLRNRHDWLSQMGMLVPTLVARDDEVLAFIEAQELFSLGIGYVDAHLLASTKLMPDALLWTRDKKLVSVAQALGLAM